MNAFWNTKNLGKILGVIYSRIQNEFLRRCSFVCEKVTIKLRKNFLRALYTTLCHSMSIFGTLCRSMSLYASLYALYVSLYDRPMRHSMRHSMQKSALWRTPCSPPPDQTFLKENI